MIKNEERVAILLATHNGEKYLSELLDSLKKQTFKDFQIFVSDDSSTDCTIDIITKYSEEFKNSIFIVNQTKKFGNACKNFMFLLENVDSEIFLFCDQDDVWLENHVQALVTEYDKISDQCKPVLIHSDLCVVDKDLNIISESFFMYSKLPEYQNKQMYFLQNNVTGCVSLINMSLKHYVFRNAEQLHEHETLIPMHDVFFGSVAAYFGQIKFLPTPLILYRQHGGNVLGAKNTKGIMYLLKKLFSNKQSTYSDEYLKFWIEYFEDILDIGDYKLLCQYLNKKNKNIFVRDCFIMKNHFLKTGMIRKLSQLMGR